MPVEKFDRLTAAAMFRDQGRELWAEAIANGRMDTSPICQRILAHLAGYRERFETMAGDVVEQEARNACAAYLDEASMVAYGKLETIFAPGLREGHDYDDAACKAFRFHHARLVKRQDARDDTRKGLETLK